MTPPPQSVLSDGSIKRLVDAGRLVIEPWDPSRVQPASVDVRLGDSFRVFHNHRVSAIDLRDPPANLTEEVKLTGGEPFVIHPGEFCLGRTLEWVELPDDIVSRVEGKALSLATEVPTPDGWRAMADLAPGDPVYDRHGHPTPVLAASEVLVDRECREVVFSDGATVVADLDHRWQVWTRDEGLCGAPQVVTTGDLERALADARAGEPPHHVDRAPPTLRPPEDPPVGGAGRAVVAVRECESRPVRCIEVGAADGVFLVTRSFVPTHNSSLGRLGLIVHATAGFVDPGWRGTLTLELNNLTRVPIKLYPGLPIAQLSFMALDRAAERPYGSQGLGSHYQGQVAATESRYGE